MSRPEPFDWTYESPRVSIEPTDDPWKRDFDDLDGEPLHLRNYAVRSYRLSRDRFLIRGVVDDRKSGDSWIPGDTEPVVVHHMVLDLVIEFPSMVIAEASVVMETHPHETCIAIEDKYRLLQGVSIARGFTHKVRDMFGGPRGCTHVTALLQAMAPVAVQSVFGMGRANRHDDALAAGADARDPMAPPTDEERRMAAMVSLNSCHVWDEEGDTVRRLRAGESIPLPLPLQRRLASHGLDPNGPVG